MKKINVDIFIAGLFISDLIGIVTLLIFRDLSFSGMCIIASAILYSTCLSSLKEQYSLIFINVVKVYYQQSGTEITNSCGGVDNEFALQVESSFETFHLLHFKRQSYKIIERPRDGIGRRRGLKIPRQRYRVGSSPTGGTKRRFGILLGRFFFESISIAMPYMVDTIELTKGEN